MKEEDVMFMKIMMVILIVIMVINFIVMSVIYGCSLDSQIKDVKAEIEEMKAQSEFIKLLERMKNVEGGDSK